MFNPTPRHPLQASWGDGQPVIQLMATYPLHRGVFNHYDTHADMQHNIAARNMAMFSTISMYLTCEMNENHTSCTLLFTFVDDVQDGGPLCACVCPIHGCSGCHARYDACLAIPISARWMTIHHRTTPRHPAPSLAPSTHVQQPYGLLRPLLCPVGAISRDVPHQPHRQWRHTTAM